MVRPWHTRPWREGLKYDKNMAIHIEPSVALELLALAGVLCRQLYLKTIAREHWCYHTINATECTSRFCICFRALPKSFHNWLKSIYMLGLCSGAQAIASATGRKGCIRNYHRQMLVPVEASVMVDRCLGWRLLSGFHGHFSQPAPVQSALCSSRS